MLFLFALIVSVICTLATIKISKRVASAADSQFHEPQKFHEIAVPRIGGAAVFVSALLALGFVFFQHREISFSIAMLCLSALPAFAIGLIEDLTKKIRPAIRFAFCCLSAFIACYLLGAQIPRFEFSWLDSLLQITPIAVVFTVFAVAGLCNAINIIDGFNGLAGFVSGMMFVSLAYVAYSVGDTFILTLSLIMAGVIFGFLVWNYPLGLIFLGDGGAYFIGFMLAEAAILLCMRNPSVSVWYPVLLFNYPIFETVFSIYRRKFIRGLSPSDPDAIHLHTLVFRRVVRWLAKEQSFSSMTFRNSATSPYLWILSGLAIVPATFFWSYQWALIGFSLLFCATYVWLYLRIVRFNTPKWLVSLK